MTSENQFLAMNIINQIGDLYYERIPSPDWVPVRQATNDQLDRFVIGLLDAREEKIRAVAWDEGKLAERAAARARSRWSLSDTSDPEPLARNPYREKGENRHD